MNAADVSHRELVEALEQALRSHDPHRQAAVRLLVEHGYWPRRLTFLDHVALATEAGRLVARVDFEALARRVDRSGASSSERAMLRLACQLAGELPARPDAWLWSLAGILAPLGHGNLRIALDAVTFAATGRPR